MSAYAVPNSAYDSVADRAYPRFGLDPEVRFGLDDRSDIGVRAPMFSGIVANYKRRLNGTSNAPGSAVAFMAGGGLVNWGDHAHIEATLLASAEDNDRCTLRLGTRTAGISPELGVFHDRSALKIHKGNILLVPAITVHGDFARFLFPR